MKTYKQIDDQLENSLGRTLNKQYNPGVKNHIWNRLLIPLNTSGGDYVLFVLWNTLQDFDEEV